MSEISTAPRGKTVFGHYAGERMPLFQLAFKTGLLTLITLGIYRFWAKTRVRKYVWSATSGDGDTFEYTGTGLEKFIGFLIAIVFLAIYLGVIQMVLFYFGMSVMVDPQTEAEVIAQVAAIYISFFAVVPFIFFAQYRARRYKLARTRWRGIRFGADKGAWGYVWRAILHTLLTIVTLGIMIPRQTYYLEKYMVDRSWYGDAPFVQGGRWQALFPGLKHVAIGLAIMIVGGVAGGLADAPVLAGVFAVVGYIWLMIGFVFYRVFAFRYLTGTKVLGGTITFSSRADTGKIVGTVIIGGLVIGVIAAIVLGVIAAGAMTSLESSIGVSPATFVAVAVLYALALVVIGALSLVWITQPVIEHIITTLEVHGAERLDDIQQRASDTGADAEGFADALDIGGGI